MDTSEIVGNPAVAAPSREAAAPTRSVPPPHESARIASLARDVVLVVLGAMLALAADEWRESRQRRERVRVALAGIREELRANEARVRQARDKHRWLADTLQKLQASRALPSPQIYMNGLFNPASVTSAAWDAARETGALADMPMATVLEVARIYRAQQDYDALGDAIVFDLMNEVRKVGIEGMVRDRFAQHIPLQIDFANRESVMLDRYRRILALPALK